MIDGKKFVRFVLTFTLGWIGSLVINHSSLKPEKFKSRTARYFFLGMVTFFVYPIIASVCNLAFDENAKTNIGYFRD